MTEVGASRWAFWFPVTSQYQRAIHLHVHAWQCWSENQHGEGGTQRGRARRECAVHRVPGSGENANYECALLPGAPQSTKTRKRDRDRAEARRLAGGPKLPLRETGQSRWRANEAWCERESLPPSVSLAAISLACARKACSRRSAMVSIGRPSARWLERDLIERDLVIASGMLVHETTVPTNKLVSFERLSCARSQRPCIQGAKWLLFAIIPFGHAPSR